MLSDDEIRLVNFVTHLPPSVNPYLAVAQYLKKEIEPPRLSKWALIILYIIVFGYGLIFFQALNLLWYRVRLNSLKTISIAQNGLLFINLPSYSVLVYFFFAPIVVVDLCFQLAIERGAAEMPHKIELLCLKFMIIYVATWAFFWVCFSQLLSSIWNEPWANPRNREYNARLPRWVLYTSHTAITCVAFWLIPFTAIYSKKIEDEYGSIRKICTNVLQSLKEAAFKYDPETFRSSDLLILMLPAKQLLTHKDNMTAALRTFLKWTTVDMIVLCALYLPLLGTALRLLLKRHAQCTFAGATCTAELSKKFAHIQNRLHQERMSLYKHSGFVYLINLAFLPPLIMQVAMDRKELLLTRKWHTVVQLVNSIL
ncbi:hypothetical protein BY996DRAFT_6636175 [Phakopsora pachyrhizi]|nr:hypothetical protein BY996DRAFT_8070805 [Phakopsora pachyrhizi]KAI8461928.1 hypothetical protein BY996DRAFT_6636175 [Phakopsora pachyrhizi]